MKKMKKIVTLALLTLSLAAANAVEITQDNEFTLKISGRFDEGLVSMDHVGSANGNALVMVNSPRETSKILFEGTDKISSDLSAGFRFGQQINPAEGTNGESAATTNTNGLYNIDSHIWLSSKQLGTVKLGRQDSITYLASNMTDVNGGLNFGSSLSFWGDNTVISATGTRSGIQSLDGTFQISNEVRYDTPSIYGFRLSTMYVAGDVADSFNAGGKRAASLIYEGVPGLHAVVDQLVGYNSTGQKNARTTVAGGNYTWNKYRFAAGYNLFENPLKEGQEYGRYEEKSIGMAYRVRNDLEVVGAAYKLKDAAVSANNAEQLSLRTDYYLSKHFLTYIGWAEMINHGAMGMAPLAVGSFNIGTQNPSYTSVVTVPGETVHVLAVGIQLNY